METRSQNVIASLEDLGHVFPDGTRTLEGVSLALRSREFVSLVGPSGCGKSTLLRLVAGLLPCSQGRIVVDPEEGIGFVFQSPVLLPWRTVLDNVALPAELQGTARGVRRRRAAELLETVGLERVGERFPAQLSGGMRMRVSIARALSTRPKILLMDEPFAALDDLTRSRLQEELLALRAREGFSTLFVTHNISEAVFLSDRVLCLSGRPARVRADIAIPFGEVRDPLLRTDARAVSLVREIGRNLSEVAP